MSSHRLTSSLVLVATVFSFSCVPLRTAAKRQGDTMAGEAVVAAVAPAAPDLAASLKKEAGERAERGEEMPWLKTMQAHWIEILLVLLAGGGGVGGTIWKLWRDRNYRGLLLEVLSRGVETFKAGEENSIAQAIAREVEATPGLSGSMRNLMQRAGVKAAGVGGSK